jgi:hypothetical protein
LKLTPRARRILRRAQVEAESFGHSYIGTEHLLLALLKDEEGIAGQTLRKLGSYERIEAELYAMMFPTPPLGYEQYPTPWRSMVVRDKEGNPETDHQGRPRQFFTDRDGRPIRGPSGRVVHLIVDDDGVPVVDSGKLRLRELDADV